VVEGVLGHVFFVEEGAREGRNREDNNRLGHGSGG
jgi:hypothetical protein